MHMWKSYSQFTFKFMAITNDYLSPWAHPQSKLPFSKNPNDNPCFLIPNVENKVLADQDNHTAKGPKVRSSLLCILLVFF